MNWTQFFDQAKAGHIARVYLFTGPENYVKQSALALLREKLLPAGLEALNESPLEGAPAQAIIEACETLPVMGERRLVVARDFAPLMPGKAKDEEEESRRLCQWLPQAPDTCCLVFYLRDAFDARKKLSAFLVRQGAQVNFDSLTDAQLDKWLSDQARLRGGGIRPDAARQLVFLAGRDLSRLGGELDKLCAYAGSAPVTRAMVDKLAVPSLEANVFRMVDSLMEGRAAQAFSLLKSMKQNGETPLGILYMLTRQVRMLTHFSLLRAQGQPLPAIQSALALSPYLLQRLETQAARFSPDRLQALYQACAQAEYRVKSGQARDQAALDQLLLTLAQPPISH